MRCTGHLPTSRPIGWRYWWDALLCCSHLWPLARVKMSAAPVRRASANSIVPARSVLRFLIAILVWNLGTGVFNPFANVFFARMHMPVEQIGYVFSVVAAGAGCGDSLRAVLVSQVRHGPRDLGDGNSHRARIGCVGNGRRSDVGRGGVHGLHGVSVYERAGHVHVVDGQRRRRASATALPRSTFWCHSPAKLSPQRWRDGCWRALDIRPCWPRARLSALQRHFCFALCSGSRSTS